MKKWIIRLGLVAIITVTITASAAGQEKPNLCRDALCWIQY
ncbi:hypothetical protein J27TS8_25310 [Robertmurraya siralis]|uniref:Uncharacterized protein n=1 Tax=Robertmurraya siralis TaxID=77777 RepID=A0A920BU24_9BACI|nr:hypothetical protein J27TS8_25310 [Robertmurraya siralis]